MSATSSELGDIQRLLNQVESVGQVRMACGAASKAAGAAYPLLDDVPQGNARTRDSLRGQLDQARIALEKFYNSIAGTPRDNYRNTWLQKGMPIVRNVYVQVAAIEGAASYVPRTSNWEILGNAIADAPRVFGEAVGGVVKTAGGAVGGAVGGILGGLGLSGMVSVAIVVAVVLVVVTKGSIITKVGQAATHLKGGG